ncbi:MAG: HlyD family secretion protein [Candidatus Acidiferrales bacterium]|jgi:membrane fusion protein (multidrug efflux system)
MPSEKDARNTETLELESKPAAAGLAGSGAPVEPAAPPSALTPQRKRILIVAGLATLVVVLALYFHYRNRVSTDDAEVDAHVTPIASKIYGNVSAVLVLDNQEVKAGQVLVRIDPRDSQAKVDQARAALTLAESQSSGASTEVPLTLATTNSDVSAAQANAAGSEAAYQEATSSDVAYAQANVAKSQAAYDKAQADLTRMKPLADKAEISQQNYDGYVEAASVAAGQLQADKEKLAQAEKNEQIADANLHAANAHLAEARAGSKLVAVRTSDAAAARARVAEAQANLDAAELELSYTEIVAPVDGVVTHKAVEPGEIVEPGQGLLVIVPLNDVWVTADYKETQLADVRPGQKAEIHVDMYGETFTGHVDSIAGATGARLSLLPPENATGNFVKVVQRIPVKILLDPIPPEKAILRPGMNVDVTILTR